MILTMIDAENRMQVLKYDGEGLTELATIRPATHSKIELAQIAATLALMAGEKNGSRPKPKVIEEPEARALPAPKPKKKKQVRTFNPNYAPDIHTDTARMLAVLELANGIPMNAGEVAEDINRAKESVGATLNQLCTLGAVEVQKVQPEGGKGRSLNYYTITQHGRDSLARSRAHG